MIYNYSFTNFQCFKEHVDVDLTLNQKVELTNWMHRTASGVRISKLMGVLGANGSGKTALLKPIAFLGWFTHQSFQSPPNALIPVFPHFASENEPTEFTVLFEMDKKLWRYELHCTQQQVLFEALYQKRERFNYVFVREWREKNKTYLIKQQDFEFNAHEAQKVRMNASLISTAAQYGVPLAQRLALPLITSNISVRGRVPMGESAVWAAAKFFATDKKINQQMQRLLSSWDLGLSGVELIEREITFENGTRKIWMPYGKHKNKKKEFKLLFSDESSGTRAAFVLLAQLLQTLAIGGIAVVDEFENDLHPHMLEPILDLFANPKTNPYHAQLFFSCHATEVLNLVHKSQIMLVQKNKDCESTASRLDAVEGVRNDDNFYAKYMAGTYGAIPNF